MERKRIYEGLAFGVVMSGWGALTIALIEKVFYIQVASDDPMIAPLIALAFVYSIGEMLQLVKAATDRWVSSRSQEAKRRSGKANELDAKP